MGETHQLVDLISNFFWNSRKFRVWKMCFLLSKWCHFQIPFLFFVFRVVGQHHLTSQDPPVCVWFISYFSTGLACCLEDFVSGPRLCVETSDNVEEALDALLEEAKLHVVDFLSDRQVPGSLHLNTNGKIPKSGHEK